MDDRITYMKKLLFLLILFGAWYHYYHIDTAPSFGPGVVAASPPYQYSAELEQIRLDDFVLSPRAEFEAEVRVLAASRYYFDRKGWLAPIAIVVGWGKMSDEGIYRNVDIDQYNHLYAWENETPDLISEHEILTSTANIHLIPANQDVKDLMYRIRIGDVLSLRGTLVNVRRTTGWKWPTSVRRDDKGDDSGEILYLKALDIIQPGTQFYY